MNQETQPLQKEQEEAYQYDPNSEDFVGALSYLVAKSEFRNSLVDIVSAHGSELNGLSPKAKEKISKIVFNDEPPQDDALPAFKEAWKAVHKHEFVPEWDRPDHHICKHCGGFA